MRKVLFPVLALVLAVGLALPMATPASANSPGSFQVALCAGQNTPVGTVTVSNDATNLLVRFNTWGGWQLVETHLAVATSLGGIPQTGGPNPNPKVGKFPYKMEHDPWVTDYLYVIPLPASTPLYIAAHAVVYHPCWEVEETAWGGACVLVCPPTTAGFRFNDRNWATYFIYEVQTTGG